MSGGGRFYRPAARHGPPRQNTTVRGEVRQPGDGRPPGSRFRGIAGSTRVIHSALPECAYGENRSPNRHSVSTFTECLIPRSSVAETEHTAAAAVSIAAYSLFTADMLVAGVPVQYGPYAGVALLAFAATFVQRPIARRYRQQLEELDRLGG